jgi:bacillopeptidase F
LGIPALIKLAIFMGNLKNTTTPVEMAYHLPPPPPHLKALPEATNSAQINLTGSSQAGDTVELFLSEISRGQVVAENDGSFQFNQITLTQGVNDFFAKSTDRNGIQSQPSNHLRLELDQQPPLLTVTEPADKTVFNLRQTSINIKGETEAEVTLFINDHLVILDQNNRFNYPFTLNNGENMVKITATDKAGNQTEKELTLTRQ